MGEKAYSMVLIRHLYHIIIVAFIYIIDIIIPVGKNIVDLGGRFQWYQLQFILWVWGYCLSNLRLLNFKRERKWSMEHRGRTLQTIGNACLFKKSLPFTQSLLE